MKTAKLEQRRKVANGPEWEARHFAAVANPRGDEVGIVGMIRAWLSYADHHATLHGARIGEDNFLGPEWAAIGSALLSLLNGSLGRLDGGTLDHVIREALTEEDFDPDNL